ncbi:CRISPR-associated helicase Cas3' [Meiothermus hypogaeus]|uniref:CRISPR-associated endonuclease/helicase Cas3 n=2 Tax=Meiothermus hypogaeus TaxID=884155 RepID=A0A511QZW9_9DEIN|nr:CRISPR-associated helicase Cas3' [Meiothermus hypogaeus]RIH74691.1 CRISPR-associated endonuclease/helicase Cas3 [Meiothermus hypogaeus]GEM82092.1 CRISPR-associated endonuclease/helicase Cas3 [Meiothermus hypogaeus NBRC 106114]GIW36406.1 MAG: CRISPR-associated endonuclease/helicase Cas3 [Meiothermus sp.]
MDRRFLRLWAKSSKDGHTGHPVIAHLLDVAASAGAILDLEPDSTRQRYAEDFGLPLEQAMPLLLSLIALHDIGKVSPAFQQKWPQGWANLITTEPRFDWKSAGRMPPTAPPEDVSHSLISQAVLPSLLASLNVSRSFAEGIADAVGCHHGFRATSLDKARQKREVGTDIWDEARKKLFETVLEMVGATALPTVQRLSPAAFMRLAGLTSFADWIGSSFYPELKFDGFEDDLPGYWEASKALARKRLGELGWTKRATLVEQPRPLREVFDYLAKASGKPFVPRPLQLWVKRLVRATDRPTLLLIEAAMGEGKTEAAFYAYLRLQAQNGHRGLYVALPTMATGNQMFERTLGFLNEQGRGREVKLDLQLIHGATQLNELYQKLQGKILPNTEREEDLLENVEARAYFTHKKQALLSEYGVGTVDQALLTVLNIKHQFVRLWGLGNRVVIIDEVHAYDTYTSELILTLVRWLHALGSSVILMSATLPKEKRRQILEAYGGQNLDTDHYPRIYKISGGQTTLVRFKGDKTRAVTVGLQAVESGLEAIVKLLEEKLENGGCAVCIVNTVDRAQELYRKIGHLNPMLFHARFPAEDRARLEGEVLARFGKNATLENGQRPEKAVLVATQVVEQSLDLDFDLMVSDLAPADLLLQRAGRLWRHKRGQRPMAEPVLYVAGLAHQGELPDLRTHYWDKVYAPFILYKTWEALRGLERLTLPADIDPLVQRVYDGAELALALSPEARQKIAEHRAEFDRQALLDRKDGEAAVISHLMAGELQLREAVQSREEDDPPDGRPIALTRKGEGSTTVIPLFEIDDKLFLDRGATRPYDPKQPAQTFMRAVRLSRVSVVGSTNPRRSVPSALEQYNQAQGIDKRFKAWEKDALLRNCVPLVLDAQGIVVIGKTEVSLHDKLGVVYRKLETQ